LVAEPIALSALKKAISGLNKLETLALPASMLITDDGSGEDWPTSLTKLQVGGRLDRQKMPSFRWPPNLLFLAFCGCENLTPEILESTLINEQLYTTLTRLEIHNSNRQMFVDRDSAILGELLDLIALRIPIDLLYRLLLLPAFDPMGPPMPIRELELTAPYDKDFATESLPEELCKALKLNLSRVCGLGISRACLGMIPESTHAKIDKWVWKNIDQCPEDELDSVFELGFYVVDLEPPC
jgi:hypothetical protein